MTRFWERDQIRKVLEAVLPGPGEFAELFLEESNFLQIHLSDKRVKTINAGIEAGINLRVGESDLSLCSTMVDFDEFLRQARAFAKEQGFRGGKISEFQGKRLPVYSKIAIPPESISLAKKVEILKRADEAARKYDKRVVQVDGQYFERIQRVLVANSEGVFEKEKRTYLTLRVNVVAKDGDLIQTGFGKTTQAFGFELFEEYPPEKIAQEAARLAILNLEANPAPAGTFTVVLHSLAGGTMIHEAVGHGFEADFWADGLSVFSGKLGQKVASDLITVVEDRTLPQKWGTASIDDEGWPTQKTVLIENGILRNILYDRKYARKLGLSQNGHGRRQSFRFLPIPRMGNTIVAPGKDDSQKIIESVKEGILIKRFGSGEVNPASGNFVFEMVEAYLIKDGKVKEPIRGATLIGNGPQVLQEIDMVGKDLEFFDNGMCGKESQSVPVGDAQPTLRIPKITVGGKAK